MKLEALTRENCELVRQWRNQSPAGLRTAYLLTREMQDRFYETIVCNPNTPYRYWALVENGVFVGMGGLINIQWENRLAEISLLIDPARQGKGFGGQAVDLLLGQAFNYLNLQTVWGEVYKCNSDGVTFWAKIVDKYRALPTYLLLKNRKYWDGQYWDSVYFSIDKSEWTSGGKKSAEGAAL